MAYSINSVRSLLIKIHVRERKFNIIAMLENENYVAGILKEAVKSKKLSLELSDPACLTGVDKKKSDSNTAESSRA